MQLLDAGGQVTSRPAPNPTIDPGWANNSLTGAGVPTVADPDTFNAVMAEFLTIITTIGGIAFSKTDVSQLAKALQSGVLTLAGADSGTANAYVVTMNPVLAARQTGLRFWATLAHASTAATSGSPATLNYGAGAVPIASLCGGENLPTNFLQANTPILFYDNGTSLIPLAGAGGVFGSASAGYRINNDGSVEQWATANTVTGSGDAVSFPISFPNQCVAVLLDEAAASGWASGAEPTIYGAQGRTTSGFSIYASRFGSGAFGPAAGTTYNYRATGN